MHEGHGRFRQVERIETLHRIWAQMVLIVLGVIPRMARSVESEDAVGHHIVFISGRNQDVPSRPIVETIRAELYDIAVDIEVETIDEMPLLPERQIAVGRRILEESDGILVFWYGGEAGHHVVFIYRTAQGARTTIRPLAGSGKEGVWDAMGMMAGGYVRYLVEENRIDIPPSSRTRKTPPRSAPTRKPPPKVTREQPNAGRWRLFGQLGYVGQMVAADGVFTHGGRLSLGIEKAWLAILGGVDLLTPVSERKDGIRLSRHRIPFHLGIGAGMPLSRWRIGVVGKVGMSIAKLTPSSSDPSVVVGGERRRFIATMELGVTAEVRLLKKLSLFGCMGGEIFPQKNVYRVVDGPTLFERHRRVQPKWQLGGVVRF